MIVTDQDGAADGRMNVYGFHLGPGQPLTLNLDVVAESREEAVEIVRSAIGELYGDIPFPLQHDRIRDEEIVFYPSRIGLACIHEEYREVKPLPPPQASMRGYRADILNCALDLYNRFLDGLTEVRIESQEEQDRWFLEECCGGDPREYLKRHFGHFVMHSRMEEE